MIFRNLHQPLLISIFLFSCSHDEAGVDLEQKGSGNLEPWQEYQHEGINTKPVEVAKPATTVAAVVAANAVKQADMISVHNTKTQTTPKIIGYCRPRVKALPLREQPDLKIKPVIVSSLSNSLPFYAEEGVWLMVWQKYYIQATFCTPYQRLKP